MSLQVVGASEFALRKRFFERAVITEARRDVAPIGDQRLVGRATSDIAANRHRAKRAAVIALAARENAITILLTGLEVILANQLNCRLCRFGAAGSEVHAAALAKIRGSKSEKARSKFFSLNRMELRGVRKGNLRGLLGHGAADFLNAMADADYGGLPGRVQKSTALLVRNPAALAANGNGKSLFEIAGKDSVVHGHEMSKKNCSRVASACSKTRGNLVNKTCSLQPIKTYQKLSGQLDVSLT